MAEQLDNKLPKGWDIIPTRELVIWLFHRISLRLDRLEQAQSLPLINVAETEPDMNKIKKTVKEKEEL
jgi:hypothetical protein